MRNFLRRLAYSVRMHRHEAEVEIARTGTGPSQSGWSTRTPTGEEGHWHAGLKERFAREARSLPDYVVESMLGIPDRLEIVERDQDVLRRD